MAAVLVRHRPELELSDARATGAGLELCDARAHQGAELAMALLTHTVKGFAEQVTALPGSAQVSMQAAGREGLLLSEVGAVAWRCRRSPWRWRRRGAGAAAARRITTSGPSPTRRALL
jgi:hypothetical protein